MLFGRYNRTDQCANRTSWRRPRSEVNPSTDPPHDSNARAPNGGPLPMIASVSRANHSGCPGICSRSPDARLQRECGLAAITGRSDLQRITAAGAPSPTVFTHSLTMMFEGQGYSSGSPADDYEMNTSYPGPQRGNRPMKPRPHFPMPGWSNLLDQETVHSSRAPIDRAFR